MIGDTDRRDQYFRDLRLAIESRLAFDSEHLPEGNTLMSKVETATTVAVSVPADRSLEIESVVLQRLIEEVRTSEPVAIGAYNRTYNRHNR
jgi:hypothetical protein